MRPSPEHKVTTEQTSQSLSFEQLPGALKVLLSEVEAAYQREDWETAERLDSQAEQLMERLESELDERDQEFSHEELYGDDDQFEDLGVEELLASTYYAHFVAGTSHFDSDEQAIENLRENLQLYGGRNMNTDTTDEAIVSAAREAYEQKAARIGARRVRLGQHLQGIEVIINGDDGLLSKNTLPNELPWRATWFDNDSADGAIAGHIDLSTEDAMSVLYGSSVELERDSHTYFITPDGEPFMQSPAGSDRQEQSPALDLNTLDLDGLDKVLAQNEQRHDRPIITPKL